MLLWCFLAQPSGVLFLAISRCRSWVFEFIWRLPLSDTDAIQMIFLLVIVIFLLLMPPGPGTPLKAKAGAR